VRPVATKPLRLVAPDGRRSAGSRSSNTRMPPIHARMSPSPKLTFSVCHASGQFEVVLDIGRTRLPEATRYTLSLTAQIRIYA
jgi:hypothetical protein